MAWPRLTTTSRRDIQRHGHLVRRCERLQKLAMCRPWSCDLREDLLDAVAPGFHLLDVELNLPDSKPCSSKVKGPVTSSPGPRRCRPRPCAALRLLFVAPRLRPPSIMRGLARKCDIGARIENGEKARPVIHLALNPRKLRARRRDLARSGADAPRSPARSELGMTSIVCPLWAEDGGAFRLS